MFEFMAPDCLYGLECNCVAWNSTGYMDCLKEMCPNDWQALRADKLKPCDLFDIDLSGKTTYTAPPIPTATWDPNGSIWGAGGSNSSNTTVFNSTSWVSGEASRDGGLSLSDKIAIGIGVGFGVPSLAVGLGAWLCARQRRRAKKEGDDESEE